MNRIIPIIFAVALSSCSHELVVGEYQAIRPTRLERLFLKVDGYEGIAGSVHLVLNADSTFTYETCGIVTEGTFHISEDSLILEHAQIFIRKSLNELESTTFDKYPFYAGELVFEVGNRRLTGSFDGVYYHLKRQ